MILIYPLLVIIAAVSIARADRHSAGWLGFASWTVTGAAFTFSLLTGLSIGLLLLPLVVILLYATTRFAPDFGDSLGFVAGAGVTLLVVASIQGLSMGWLLPGVACSSIALASLVAVRRVAGQHRL